MPNLYYHYNSLIYKHLNDLKILTLKISKFYFCHFGI